MPFLRSVLFDLCLVVWTLCLGLMVPVLMVLNEPARVRATSRVWSHGIVLGLRVLVGLRFREIGTENKRAGPALYAANHQSAFETLVFNRLLPDVAIVLKDSLYKLPIFGWYLKKSPMIAIDRSSGLSAMRKLKKEGQAALDADRPILIFPEGTRQDVDTEMRIQKGIYLLYSALKVPVVPVALNSGLFWVKNGMGKRAGEITVSYLPPIEPGLDQAAFIDQLKTAIQTEKARLVESANP